MLGFKLNAVKIGQVVEKRLYPSMVYFFNRKVSISRCKLNDQIKYNWMFHPIMFQRDGKVIWSFRFTFFNLVGKLLIGIQVGWDQVEYFEEKFNQIFISSEEC